MENLKNSSFQSLQARLNNYSFKYNERIESDVFDAIIYDKQHNPFAIVTIRERVGGINKKALGIRNNPNFKHKVYIVIQKDLYRVYDISKNSEQESPIYHGNDIGQVITAIKKITSPIKDKDIDNCVYNNLRKVLFSLFYPVSSTHNFVQNKEKEFDAIYPLSRIKKSVKVDKSEKIVKPISNSKESYEALLLDVLIEDLEEKNGKIRLYRYSTLEAIFSTIKYFTYRFNGIQGMNDQKEGLFLLEELFDKKQEANDRTNDIFISSCSTQYDNLTMWRLYGDNSKGASITLELVDDYKNKPFYIKKLFYRDFKRIKTKIQLLNAQINELGYIMDSKMFSFFPFFIKSNHYDTEAEVRILFDKSLNGDNDTTVCDWGISEPYKIIRPYVDIKMFKADSNEYNNILPFKITEIILGPNCPFSERNIDQIKYYLKENKLFNIEVKASRIDKDTYIG